MGVTVYTSAEITNIASKCAELLGLSFTIKAWEDEAGVPLGSGEYGVSIDGWVDVYLTTGTSRWRVSTTISIPTTRESPEDRDTIDVGFYPNPLDAVKRALHLAMDMRIDNALMYANMRHLAQTGEIKNDG